MGQCCGCCPCQGQCFFSGRVDLKMAMESFYGADTSNTNGNGLGQFQLIMILAILTGLPFGMELLLRESTAAVGYLLLFGLALSIFFILPLIFILSELASIVPTNHGSVGYVYRALHPLSPRFADLIGCVCALNLLFLFAVRLGLTPLRFEEYLMQYMPSPPVHETVSIDTY